MNNLKNFNSHEKLSNDSVRKCLSLVCHLTHELISKGLLQSTIYVALWHLKFACNWYSLLLSHVERVGSSVLVCRVRELMVIIFQNKMWLLLPQRSIQI